VTADYNSHENQEISVLTSKKARTRLKKTFEVKEIIQGITELGRRKNKRRDKTRTKKQYIHTLAV
jgi:hypothetical protein